MLQVAGMVATVQPTPAFIPIPMTTPPHAKSVRLPYSLVLGMNINLTAFQKALSALGKQQLKTPASPFGSMRFKRAKLDYISSHQDLSKSLSFSLFV